MSGDVQPRKRKDKKKKKDELGVEEPRGTAAALGEGDVFIHTQQDHGTGGHWCAKIIFFSLLAILITLIGLIILENRGLTELEANSVESRYSGVLEGWLEDAPDDDHHDEHTLDLKHHDDEEGEDEHNIEESDHEDEDEDEDDHEDEDHDDEEDHEDEESLEDTEADADDVDQDESQEDNIEADEDEEENVASNEVDSNEEDDNQSEENLQDNEDVEEKVTYKWYQDNEEDDEDNDGDEDGEIINDNKDDDDDDSNNEYYGQNDGDDDDDDDQDDENDYQKDDDEEKNDDLDEQSYNDVDQNDDQSVEDNDQYGEDDDDSKELNQDSDLSNEITYENDNDDDDDDNESNEQKDNEQENEDEEEDSQEDDDEEIEKIEKEVDEDDDSNEIVAHTNADGDEQEASKEDREADDDDDDDDDLQDQEDDEDEPPLERITAQPAGKPFVEIEEEIIEKPVNTLAEEEEYERRQEQLRREEEDAAQGSQIWLKLAVGGALLVATHAVVRRATAPRDIPEPEEHTREETPIVDRRMTIVPEQPSPRVQESPLTQIAREIEEEVFKKPAPVTKSAPIVKQDSAPVVEKAPVDHTKDEEKELYSEEEEAEDEEEEEEDIEEPLKEFIQKKSLPVVEQKPSEDSEPEDVEIVDDEQIEEELEDEEIEDEEEISDVDDTELLTRLEAKYGRLPEPERFGRKPDMSSFGPKHKDGGNSIEDDWPGEPSEAYWRTELNVAQEELRQGDWSSCERRVSAAALAGSGRARWLAARAADLAAEAKRDNSLLSRAIAAYLHLLKMNERLSDKKLLEVAQRAIDRIQFRGTYLNAEPIYRLLIRRFPDDVHYRNNLTVSFLMANRADLADEVLKETLRLWPNDRVALAHHGFVLKTQYNKLEEAVKALYKALEGDAGPANEPRFYYHLGDALLLLGRPEEAHEVHKRGAALGHFLSPAQRSLYNVPRLRSRPWWPVEETPYVNLARALERSWRDILKEGEAAKELYEKEKEGLKERGEWTQLDVFVRGAEIPGRCTRAPVTCSIVRSEAAAARCRRGQVKFSAMEAGTHVRAHVGPTNCRLRMHLGLSNTKNTYIRVDKETRQWQTGKTFIFDDSFEHEVWHNGSGARLVLIVDVWHPDLSAHERRTLPAI